MSMDDIDFEGIARKIAESDSRGPTSRVLNDAERDEAAEADIAALTARIVADENAKSADADSADIDEDDASDEDWGDGWSVGDDAELEAASATGEEPEADNSDTLEAATPEDGAAAEDLLLEEDDQSDGETEVEVRDEAEDEEAGFEAAETASSDDAASGDDQLEDTDGSELEMQPSEDVVQTDSDEAQSEAVCHGDSDASDDGGRIDAEVAATDPSLEEPVDAGEPERKAPLDLGLATSPVENEIDSESDTVEKDDESIALPATESDQVEAESEERITVASTNADSLDADDQSDVDKVEETVEESGAPLAAFAVERKAATPERFPTGSDGDPDARRPRICLMGEFSAGKSTLSNLLIGARSLPVNVTATQLPPVWISWGDRAPYRVDIDGEHIPVDLNHLETVPVEETSHIRIFRRSDLLEICDLIDMPGISDPNMSAEVWQRVLPKADAVIWCTHATQAWRQSEAAVWDTMPRDIQEKSILLLTRMDKIRTERDRVRVMRRVGKETDGLFRAQFGVSLVQALAAGDDEEIWRESGAEDFAVELVNLIREIQTGLADPDVIAREEARAMSTSLTRRPTAPAMPAVEGAEQLDDPTEMPSDVHVQPARVRPRSVPAGRERSSERRRSSDLRL